MHDSSYAKMQSFVARYLGDCAQVELHILDVGARSVQGHRTYRDLFVAEPWRFCGLDIEDGPNVDIVVADPYRWSNIEPGRFDVVISGQALEHIEFPWKTFAEIRRVLKPGGLFCLIVPSAGEEHRYPVDCWRYYPDSMRALATDSGLHAVEVFTDFGLGNWQDTFAVFQKPLEEGGAAPFPRMANRDAAFAEFRKALETRPRNPQYYTNLAAHLRERGLHDEVQLACRTGAEVFPNNPQLKQEVVNGLLAAGELSAAAEHAVALLGLRPILPESIEAAGAVFARLDDKRRAYYGALLPIEVPALKRVATVAHDTGAFRLAALCWESLAQREPEDESHATRHALALWGCRGEGADRAPFLQLRDRSLAAGEVTRTTVVQQFIRRTGARRYLEIGVEQGINFFQIDAPSKFAVDPEFKIPGGAADFDGHRFFETTSDAFFAAVPAEIREHGIDIALVDGLHTYEQALRDVENCVRHLAPGGLVVMHDCLPATAIEAAPSLEEARAMRGFKQAWTGDVYRAVAHLRAFRPDLFVAVLDADHGIGIVQKGRPESILEEDAEVIRNLSFQALRQATGRWLNLKPAGWFEQNLERLAGLRAAA
jgi:SAM-dependent methyltransferase